MTQFIQQIPRPSVTVITGRRGSGKDVTAVAAAVELHKQTGKEVHSNYSPEEFKLPKYWKQRSGASFKENSIQLISDAHLDYFSRDWQSDMASTLIKIVSISRHNDIDFIWTTQLTSMLDRQMIANIDVIMMKEPSTLAAKFERPEVREMTETAVAYFSGMSQQQKWESAAAFTHIGEEYITDIKKPPFWTEKMSKLYASNLQQKPLWQRIF